MTPAEIYHQAIAYRQLRDRGGCSFLAWVQTKGFSRRDVERIHREVQRLDKFEQDGVPF